MASQTIMNDEIRTTDALRPDGELLQRLLDLYAEEEKIYRQVLELSRQQGNIMRQGGGLGKVRRVLEEKKNCLEAISRLERMEKRNKQEWDRLRPGFSRANRNRLQQALNQVTDLIEEILTCEEANDLYLLEQARMI